MNEIQGLQAHFVPEGLLLFGTAEAQNLAERVRTLLILELSVGTPKVPSIARKLGKSERSLARQLHAEGTSFSVIFEDVRRSLAIHYVGRSSKRFAEISEALCFSHPTAFFRAFRRWTQQSPRQYRFRPLHLE